MLSIDHSLTKRICLYECEYAPPDSISLEKLRAQMNLYSGYAALVNRFLDFGFVLQEAPKYGIVRISFYDPACSWMHPDWYEEKGWKDGTYAKIQGVPDRKGQYEIFFNPSLNLEEAAREISKRTGLRIMPDEVYYFSWFHECGHTRKVAGDLCPERLLPLYLRAASDREVLVFKLKAEDVADAWAIKELRKWRRHRSRQARTVLPAMGLLHA